ncbi:MAG: hypothetical protein R3Y33_00670 [Clostridia bacterium]
MKKIVLMIMVFVMLTVSSIAVSAEEADTSTDESSVTSDVLSEEESTEEDTLVDEDSLTDDLEEESSDPFDGYILIGQITTRENSISGTLSTLGMVCIGAGIVGVVAVILWSILGAIAYKKKQKALEEERRKRMASGKKRRKRPDGSKPRKKRPRPEGQDVQHEQEGSTIIIPTEEIEERNYVANQVIEKEKTSQDNQKQYDTQEILRDFLDN